MATTLAPTPYKAFLASLIEKLKILELSEKEREYLLFLVRTDEIFLSNKKYRNYKEFLEAEIFGE